MRLLAAILLLFAGITTAFAQGPGPGPGPVPSPWVVNGNVMSPQGNLKAVFTASSNSYAGMNVNCGSAPASPVNGDFWCTTAGAFIQINGATVGPLTQGAGASFSGVSPIAVSFPSSVVTYSLNYNSSLALYGSNLGINLANTNTFTVFQSVNLNAVVLQSPQTGVVLQLGQLDGTPSRIELDSYAAASRYTCVRADNTNAAPATLQGGDEVCSLNAFGYNGSAFVGPQGAFRIYANQTWVAGSAYGTYADIALTPNGQTTQVEIAVFSALSAGPSGSLKIFGTNIGAVSTDSLILQNATAASAGAQQWSPRVHWIGQGWASGSSASMTADWIAEEQTIQGSSAPTSRLVFSSQVNGSGYSSSAYIASNGSINAAIGYTVGGAAPTAGNVLRSNGTMFVSATLAASDLSNGVTGSGAVVLASGPSIATLTVTSAFTATGLVTLADLATQATNTVLANATGGMASPTAFAMPSCSSAGNALTWVTNTGFVCGTITAAASSVAVGTTTVGSGTLNGIFYTASGPVVGNTNALANAVLVTNGSNVPSLSVTLPSGIAATNMALTTPVLGVAAGTSLALGGGSIGGNALEVTGTSAFNGAVAVVSASFGLNGSISAAAWTTNGIRYKNAAATLTDTTSTGTVAAAYSDVWGGSTIAASSAVTFTNYYGSYFKAPTAGTNVTLTNKYAIGGDSANFVAFSANGGAQTFPASGLIVGTTDTQTLTNKSISGAEINSGVVAATYLPTASSSALGVAQCDGSTITCAGGVFTAVGAVAASVGIGTTTITAGTNGAVLASNGGTLGNYTLNNFIGGLVLSNDGTSPNSVLNIAAGTAMDSTNGQFIQIGAFTKSTAGAWASGSGSNGMGNGLTVANNTWYHVCLAYNGGTSDIWFDTSATCANKPSSVSGSLYRRIGSFKTAAATTNILAFTQVGNTFIWASPVNDLSSYSVPASTTAKVVTVPLGVRVTAKIRITYGSGSASILVNSPVKASGGLGASAGNLTLAANGNFNGSVATIDVITDTSQHIELMASATGTTVNESTYGWIDSRGQ